MAAGPLRMLLRTLVGGVVAGDAALLPWPNVANVLNTSRSVSVVTSPPCRRGTGCQGGRTRLIGEERAYAGLQLELL